jgi:hypothetical protein
LLTTLFECLNITRLASCDGIGQKGENKKVERFQKLRPVITTWFDPRGEVRPWGVKFAHRGELCPARGEHSLLFRRMKGRTENFTTRS